MKEEIFIYKSIEYIIYIGENEQDNFDIIDASSENDIWFHVDGMPSCHVILKTTDSIKKIPNQVIKRCAYLCKINSKAKTLKQIGILYTTINNITKTETVGSVYVNKHKIIIV